MARVFRYRSFIRWGQYVVPMVFVVLCLGLLAVLNRPPKLSGLSKIEAGFLSAFSVGMCVIAGSICWYLYYRLAGVSVELDDDALLYHSRSGTQRLKFDDMLPLRFPSVRYAGGFVKVRTGETTIRITVVMEGIGELLRELKAALDEHRRSDCYDANALFRFLKTAEYSDQSWDRIYENLWKLLLGIALAAGFGFLFGWQLGLRQPLPILLALGCALWPLLLYLITEVIFLRRIARLADPEQFTCPGRDPDWERIVSARTIKWGIASFFILGLAIAVCQHLLVGRAS